MHTAPFAGAASLSFQNGGFVNKANIFLMVGIFIHALPYKNDYGCG